MSNTVTVRHVGRAYTVFINGRPTKSANQEWKAHAQAKRLREELESCDRPCLTCCNTFQSAGIHNRMCQRCRSKF